MPLLGLGLGLDRYLKKKGGDPLLEALTKANCTLYLEGDRATGTSKGVNSPLTDPWVDLIGNNNADLVNFVGTTSSGYDDLLVPNGETRTFLKGDGVDDYGVIANDSSLDPTGTEDFSICYVGYLTNLVANKWLFCKNLGTFTSDVQYGIRYTGSGNGWLRVGGQSYTFDAGTIVLNGFNIFVVKKIGSTLRLSINGVEVINISFTISLVSRPYFLLFARNNSTTSILPTEESDQYMGDMAFFYNGPTGLNETDVDAACELIRRRYFV